MLHSRVTRRTLLERTALATTALVAAPFVRSAHAAGKLSIGFWDHWVPGANKASKTLVKEWAAKEKVEVQIDYITSQGNKNLLTIAAEAQAKSGHDIFALPTWLPPDHAKQPRAGRRHHGRADQAERQGQPDRRVSRRTTTAAGSRCRRRVGSQIKGPCSRIDLMKQHAGIDVQAMYPAGSAAEGRQLDARRLPQGGRGLPQGRLPVRHRSRHDRR